MEERAQPKGTSSGKFYRVSWKSAMYFLTLPNDTRAERSLNQVPSQGKKQQTTSRHAGAGDASEVRIDVACYSIDNPTSELRSQAIAYYNEMSSTQIDRDPLGLPRQPLSKTAITPP